MKQVKVSFTQSIVAGLLAGITAAIINAVLFFIFHAAGTLRDTVFIKPNQSLTIVPVIIASILPAIIGAVVFFLFEKFTKNGYRIFSIVSVVLVLVSLSGPFTSIPNVPTGYALVLCAMHVVVAAALLYFVRRKVKENHTDLNAKTGLV